VTNVDAQGMFHVMDANGKEKVWSAKHLAEIAVLDHSDKVGDNTGIATTSAVTTTTTTTTIRRR
jgi:hypothetical protein